MAGTGWRWLTLLLVCALAAIPLLRAGPGWLGADKDPARNVVQVVVWALTIITGLSAIGAMIRKWFTRPEEAALDILGSKLASTMQIQWDRAARDRRLWHPAPLPIRWQWARFAVAGPPSAAIAVGEGPARFDPLPGLAPVTLDRLSEGNRQDLHNLYGGLASGRLVITGTAGAGKSSAAVLLLLDALRYREQAANDDDRRRIPIPVMFTFQGWDPTVDELEDWLIGKLVEVSPFQGRHGARDAKRMLRAGRIAVFLDGLDEISPSLRPLAVDKLSDEANFRLVLLTRPDELADIARDGHLLVGAAALELRPISGAEAAEYLLRPVVAPTPPGWQAIADALTAPRSSSLTEALSNPLMITLVRDAYPPGKPVEELLDEQVFPTHDDIANHLLDLAVRTAYAPKPGHPPPAYSLEVARHTLTYIAHHLEREGTRDLSWWKIAQWEPSIPRRILGGLVGAALLGSILGFVSVQIVGHWDKLLIGFLFAVGFVIGFVAKPATPARTLPFWRWSTIVHERLVRKLAWRLIVAFPPAFLLGFGSIAVAGLVDDNFGRYVKPALQTGLLLGIAVGIGYAPAQVVLASDQDDWGGSTDPRGAWRHDLTASLAIIVVQISVLTFVALAGAGLIVDNELWIGQGLLFAVLFGACVLVGGLFESKAFPLLMSQVILRVRGRPVPLRMLRFLEDARARHLLRTVGPLYQFRHAALQERLAGQYPG